MAKHTAKPGTWQLGMNEVKPIVTMPGPAIHELVTTDRLKKALMNDQSVSRVPPRKASFAKGLVMPQAVIKMREILDVDACEGAMVKECLTRAHTLKRERDGAGPVWTLARRLDMFPGFCTHDDSYA